MKLFKHLCTVTAIALATVTFESNAASKRKKTKRYPEKADYIAANNSKIFRFSKDGEATWEFPANGLTHDIQYLPNGNILFASGTHVREVTPDKQVVFEYRPENQNGGGVYSCQRLPNGKTVIGENSTCRVLEFDKSGKQVFALQCSTKAGNKHHYMRLARKLRNGNYLVCHSGENIVKEYTPKGKVVWEQKTDQLCFQAERLKNGNTLICTLPRLIEYKPDGSIAWEFKNTDVEGTLITNMTGFKLQPNGNVLIGCYGAYRGGKGTGMFEINRKKELVWKYANPSMGSCMMAVDKVQKPSKKKRRR